ncbi:hypothetical protein QTH87_00395 [Variovorax sp. J22P168]|uniref:hypothetical protein n=1 Tax=Variovorax jilinensis TaxID=3053513 RepID=UPI002577E53C|nr:hypothetical protein [Variovorax sp. J22P168]MDM0010883.1 hypothetical protein [Variovorax sp. J22P168]
MSAIERILPRLDKVRQRSNRQWSARCPAHQDRGPSLSIKELPDGRILMHCFGGCDVASVVDVIGLELSDLFPPSGTAFGPGTRSRLLPAGQALQILEFEALLIATVAGNIAQGGVLTEDDHMRLLVATGRILAIAHEVRA